MVAYEQHGAAMAAEQQQDGGDVHVDITGEHDGSSFATQAALEAAYAGGSELMAPKACRWVNSRRQLECQLAISCQFNLSWSLL